jgi:hypothetical protein
MGVAGAAGDAGCDDGRDVEPGVEPGVENEAENFHRCSITCLPSAFCSFRPPDSFKLIGARFRSFVTDVRKTWPA